MTRLLVVSDCRVAEVHRMCLRDSMQFRFAFVLA